MIRLLTDNANIRIKLVLAIDKIKTIAIAKDKKLQHQFFEDKAIEYIRDAIKYLNSIEK